MSNEAPLAAQSLEYAAGFMDGMMQAERDLYRQGYNDGVRVKVETSWLWGPKDQTPETD